MNKMFALLAAIGLALGVSGIALADDGVLHDTGPILIAVNGNIDVAAGEHADAVVVVGGDAHIAGSVTTLFVANGSLTTTSGATFELITIVNGTADLAAGTSVTRNVNQLNSTINTAEGAQVGGSVRDISGDVVAFGLFMGAAAIVLWIGFAVATLFVVLLLAGLAARQVRVATTLISREPVKTLLAGLLAIVIPPLLAVIAFVTIIGIPAGLGLLFVLWPAAAFVGYLVAAIWMGEWLLARGGRPPAERPYLAGFVGLLLAFVLGIIPFLTAVISIFGLGAVVLAAWRTLRRSSPPTVLTQPQPQPVPPLA